MELPGYGASRRNPMIQCPREMQTVFVLMPVRSLDSLLTGCLSG